MAAPPVTSGGAARRGPCYGEPMRLRHGLLLLLTVLAACQRSPAASDAGGASPAPPGAAGAEDHPPAAPPARLPAPSPATSPVSDPVSDPGAPPAPGPAAPTTATPTPVTGILREAVALEPGGGTVTLAHDTESVVDPSAGFRVDLAAPCADARLALIDRSDALVAATGTQEVGATTRLTLNPAAPLVPARRYTLRIDGAVTRELHDSAGKAFLPGSFPLLVAGEPPKPQPKPKPATKRRRSRR